LVNDIGFLEPSAAAVIPGNELPSDVRDLDGLFQVMKSQIAESGHQNVITNLMSVIFHLMFLVCKVMKLF
jgi:hypothetical protein